MAEDATDPTTDTSDVADQVTQDPTPAGTEPASTTDDQVVAMLTEHGVTDESVVSAIKGLGVTSVDDLGVLTEVDFVNAGVPLVQARKLAQAIMPEANTEAHFSSSTFVGVLPAVPEFDSLLGMLKAGGVLKVEVSTVIAAVQASIAQRAGLFDVPDKLASGVLDYAVANEEPVDQSYWPLKQQLTRRNYGDLFAALDGFDGRNVSEAAKRRLFAGIDQHLWPGLAEFAGILDGWMDAWTKSTNNPAAMMAAVQSLASGGHGQVGPAIGVAPDTGGLRDQADKFNDSINRAFAGEGVQIAAAVAYDAKRIREALANPRLPALVGAANYEQMLRQLGVAVSAADTRIETNVVQYVMGLMQTKNVPGGNDELSYFNALYMLGTQIPWDQLGINTGGYSGVAGRVPRDDRL